MKFLNFIKRIDTKSTVFALLTFIIGWQIGHFDLSLQWKNYKPSFQFRNSQPPANAQSIDFKLFWDTWDLVSKEYVDKKAIDPQKMYYGAIQGMVASLGDPYTVFLPPDQQKSTLEQLSGTFDGVGIILGYNKDKRLVVIAPLKDTPAEKAGVKAGDLIVKIDSKDTSTLSLPEAVALIRGSKGTKVNLQIFRDGDSKPRDISLQRETINVKSVEYSQKTTPEGKKVALIKLSQFGDKTITEWNDAITSAVAQNPDGVVLDLRNNPGGYLDAAVFIGAEFIDSGDIVLQEDGQGQRQSYPVKRAGKLTKQPLVVLINKGSASASEIVAGAIQDHKRGKLVGEQSFGKGTIQAAETLPNDTGIHITKAKWLTPNGRWIHNIGLTPDVTVEAGDDPLTDLQLNKALQVLDQN